MRVFSNTNCPFKLKYAYMYFYFHPFSVQSRFTMYHYTSMHTHICTHVSDARAIYIMQMILPSFAEVKVLQQQNMLKAGLLRYKELQLPKICRGTEIVRMDSNNPRSPLETNYR